METIKLLEEIIKDNKLTMSMLVSSAREKGVSSGYKRGCMLGARLLKIKYIGLENKIEILKLRTR